MQKRFWKLLVMEVALLLIKKSENPSPCFSISCSNCLFYIPNEGICNYKKKRKWAESEYIEKPVISKKDRVFLEYLSVNIQYIARDMSGRLYIYVRKPYKQIDCWSSSERETEKALWMFNVDFPMVKWSDSEPWLIEYLKKVGGS